jgi:hypothetical protein
MDPGDSVDPEEPLPPLHRNYEWRKAMEAKVSGKRKAGRPAGSSRKKPLFPRIRMARQCTSAHTKMSFYAVPM